MSRLTPAEFAEKHARRLKGATEDIRTGIAKVTESPTAKAAAKADKMLSHLTASVQSGKWARGLQKVSLEDWKNQATNVGIGRIASGIDAAKGKVTDFATQLLPHVDAGVAKIKGMPDLTLEDSINRATTFIRHMGTFSKK